MKPGKGVGVFHSRVREEEKAIFRALRASGVPFQSVDVRRQVFNLHWNTLADSIDLALMRCLSHTHALYVSRMLELQGIRAVNTHSCIKTCGDKVLTAMALEEAGQATPKTIVAFSQEAGLDNLSTLGYPVVVKPPVGSWGRLMAKVNDREAAEAVLEHKGKMNGDDPFFLQEYVKKPGRDIRTLVVGEQTVYAIYRQSEHWITNVARSGEAMPCPITEEIDQLSRAAASAVGGEVVAIDLLETAEGNLLINEVNHTPEFQGAVSALEIDVAEMIVQYLRAQQGQEK